MLGVAAEIFRGGLEEVLQYAMRARWLDEHAFPRIHLKGALSEPGLRREHEGCIADAACLAAWTSMRRRVPQLSVGLGVGWTACSGEPRGKICT